MIRQKQHETLPAMPLNRGDEFAGVLHEVLSLTPDRDHPEQLLKLKIESDKIKQHYDFVLIDTASVLSWLTLNALAAADIIVVPFIPSYSAPSTFTQLSEGIKSVKLI